MSNPFMASPDPPIDGDYAWHLDQGRRLLTSAGVEPGDLASLTWDAKTDGEMTKLTYTGTFGYWGESDLWIEIKGPRAPGHYRMPVAALHRVVLERKGKATGNPFVDLQEIAFNARDETKSKYSTALEAAREILMRMDIKEGDFVKASIRKGQVDDDRNVDTVTGTVKSMSNATIVIDGVNGEPKVYRQTHLALLAAIEKESKYLLEDVPEFNPFIVNSAPANPFMV